MEKEKITQEVVEKVARLVKLDISGQEGIFVNMFEETLKAVNVLDELDTSSTKETYQVTGLKNVFQDKEKGCATISQKDALSNASEEVNNLFATKAVFDR